MKRIQELSKGWLTDLRAYLLVSVCSVILIFPSLFSGLAADDYFLRAITLPEISIPNLPASPLDAFAFVKPNPQILQQCIERGILPWWTHPQIRIAFWRPLSALTHWLDFYLFPNTVWLMHAHNILWYVILGMAILFFYRRFFVTYSLTPITETERYWLAGIAALLYVIDDAHGMGVGWISNRNAIVATVCGIGALLMHDQWRRMSWWPGALLSPILLALGLLGGESAVAVCGYLFAYALCIDRGTLRSRVCTLIPCAIIAVLWRTIYTRFGYGVIGTGLYLDPGQNPAFFLTELVQRLPVLLLGQFGIPNAAVWTLVPPFWAVVIFFLSLTFLSFVAWMLLPMLQCDPLSRFFAIGMVLSSIPSCATYPNDRLLFFTGIGGMGLIAQYLAQGMQSLKGPIASFPKRPFWAAQTLFFVWFVLHLIISPLMLPVASLTPLFFDRPVQWGVSSFPDHKKGLAIIVNLPIDMMLPYIFLAREGQSISADSRLLTSGLTAVEIEGVNTHTVIVRAEGGLLNMPWDQVFRDKSLPFQPGHTQILKGLTIVVTKVTKDGRPAEIRYTFDKPLNDPSLQWITWSGRRFEPFKPPVSGERIVIKQPSLFWWM